MEIGALALMLKCPIVLLEEDRRPFIYNKTGEGNPIFLQHQEGKHFVSCIPLEGYTAQGVFTVIKNKPHYG